MKFWLQHCFSELLNISRSIFIWLDNLLLLSGMNNLFMTQVFALRFDVRSNRVKLILWYRNTNTNIHNDIMPIKRIFWKGCDLNKNTNTVMKVRFLQIKHFIAALFFKYHKEVCNNLFGFYKNGQPENSNLDRTLTTASLSSSA